MPRYSAAVDVLANGVVVGRILGHHEDRMPITRSPPQLIELIIGFVDVSSPAPLRVMRVPPATDTLGLPPQSGNP